MARVTIHDIAREVNSTPSTVSKALNDHPSISAATKEMIKAAALNLNYRQNRLASSLRSGKTNIIGIIIPSSDIGFFGAVVHGIEKVARSNGYNILLFQSHETGEYEVEGVETLLQTSVDGIIASIAKDTPNLDHFYDVKKRKVPLILFDRVKDELESPSVVVDDYRGAYMATEHLIGQGYSRIAHISGPQHVKIFNDRLCGYADALRAYNLPVDDDLIQYGKTSIESGQLCAEQLMQTPRKPDAIFAAVDITALGALQRIKQLGYQMPGQVGLIGFGNESFSPYVTPSLSSVDQQPARMGEESFQLFLNAMAKKGNGQIVEEETEAPTKIILDPVLVIRESSQRKHV
ncbi:MULTISPECIES: LacI family DNA-binding transcriptional regulator [Rufibacter]|uniref:LacI family transcriptional regulator n=1 Tax=Rufibacter quisquiliarum TaxID=1549639 RepID=A0A839GDZ4_9BACT|nr:MULTISPECIES: LacI family DNA-binding transcriptional regulator [Rufibacter]MBA9077824.1 LacI family transcriptional regulator [Rufibacter quisquiliarum]